MLVIYAARAGYESLQQVEYPDEEDDHQRHIVSLDEADIPSALRLNGLGMDSPLNSIQR